MSKRSEMSKFMKKTEAREKAEAEAQKAAQETSESEKP